MNLKAPDRDQVIALAGVFQACYLVDKIATTGSIRPEAMDAAMSSLLNQNPENCEAVFGSLGQLSDGLDTMEQLLAPGKRNKAQDILRYAIGVLHLQRKILKHSVMLATIGEGIEKANTQATHFAPGHDNVIDNLADLYSKTISSFRFRIQVSGQGGFLRQTSTANRVRCLLFAGIRAAILWHQTGGRRWHFIFYRKQLAAEVKKLRRAL